MGWAGRAHFTETCRSAAGTKPGRGAYTNAAPLRPEPERALGSSWVRQLVDARCQIEPGLFRIWNQQAITLEAAQHTQHNHIERVRQHGGGR